MDYKLRGKFRTDKNAIYDILTDRGVKDIEAYIHPTSEAENNPYDLKNIDAAATLLIKFLNENKSICILADADNDGYCSAAILWNYITQIFPNADLHFTLHDSKAHGLEDKINWFIDEEQYDLILVPDAGSYDVQYFWRLNKINTYVICLDHHPQMYNSDNTPIINDCPTAIVVNNQLSSNYANKDFCGAGIVYKFCQVLDDKFGIDLAFNFIDLAAVGNIGDVMFQGDPETRYVIIEGLKHIKNKGLQAFIASQAYSLKERADPPYAVTPIDIAFYISPLINAVVRVGTYSEKEVIFYALTQPDRQMQSTKRGAKTGDIELAAEQAARIAKNVKARQDRIKEKALDLVNYRILKDGLDNNNLIIVELYPDDNIPNELTGLIAQNIVSQYNKPCFIVRRDLNNVLKGSLRNNGNFKDLPALRSVLEQTNLFELLAGHENAAGLGIAAAQVPSLLNFMNTNFSTESFKNCYLVDYILDARNNNGTLLTSLAKHQDYYGNGIDEPRIIIQHIELSNILIMGANKDSIKISFNGVDYIKFKDLDFIEQINANRMLSLTVYGRINLNEFMGKTSVQVFIDDYEFIENSKNHKYDF